MCLSQYNTGLYYTAAYIGWMMNILFAKPHPRVFVCNGYIRYAKTTKNKHTQNNMMYSSNLHTTSQRKSLLIASLHAWVVVHKAVTGT